MRAAAKRSNDTDPPLRIDILFERAHAPDPRVRRVSSALAEAGYEVRVLAWDRTGTLPVRERVGQVDVRRVGIRSRQGLGWRQLFFLARVVARYARLVRSRRPDVLHAVDLPMLVAALAIAPFSGRPRIVYDAFEIYSVMESAKYPGWMLRAIAWLEARLPRLADAVIVVGQSRQSWFRERGVESVIVANWIDRPVELPTAAAARSRLGLPGDRLIVLYAGGLDPSRDVDSLLRFAARHPADTVIIAGGGSEEERLRREAAGLENVAFLGFVQDPTWITAAADVLFYSLRPEHPYAAYAAPNNLYMSISHEVPLVHRGQGEIGLVAATELIGAAFHDDASLDRAIEVLRDPATARAVRLTLRRLQESYSWARAREALWRAYQRIGATARSDSTNGP